MPFLVGTLGGRSTQRVSGLTIAVYLTACGTPAAPAAPRPSSTTAATDDPANSAPTAASTAPSSAAAPVSSAVAAPSAAPPATTASAKPLSPPAAIAVVPFKAKVDRDGHSFVIELAADGKVTLDGRPFAKVDADTVVSKFGTLRLASDGTVIPSFDRHVGKFTADDGLVDEEGNGMRLRDDGTAEMSDHGETRKVPLKVEKMQPGKRRTALLVCVAVLGFIQARERQDEQNGSPGGPPPPPPPPR